MVRIRRQVAQVRLPRHRRRHLPRPRARHTRPQTLRRGLGRRTASGVAKGQQEEQRRVAAGQGGAGGARDGGAGNAQQAQSHGGRGNGGRGEEGGRAVCGDGGGEGVCRRWGFQTVDGSAGDAFEAVWRGQAGHLDESHVGLYVRVRDRRGRDPLI